MYKTRKIYYDLETGEVIYSSSYTKKINVDFGHDYSRLTSLNARNKETIGLLVLNDNKYAQDFAECNGYRVNPETKTLEFSYPDPNEEELQEPVYQAPLSEQVKELEYRTEATENALLAIMMTGGI